MIAKVNINDTANFYGLIPLCRHWTTGGRTCTKRGFNLYLNLTHVLHELAADGANVLAQCGTEHHDLLLVGRHLEDFLDIAPHV